MSAWIECYDDQGNLYYYNTQTDESSWDKPPGFSNKPNPPTLKQQVEDDALPPNWIECQDDQGNTYFYNTATDESSWERPVAPKGRTNNAPPSFGNQPTRSTPPTSFGSSTPSSNESSGGKSLLGKMLSKGKEFAKSLGGKDDSSSSARSGGGGGWGAPRNQAREEPAPNISGPTPSRMPDRNRVASPPPGGQPRTGQKLERSRSRSFDEPKQVYCPNCGVVIPDKFCVQCGTAAPKPAETESAPAKKEPMTFEQLLQKHNVSQESINKLVKQKVNLNNMGMLTENILKDEFGITVWGDRVSIMEAVKSYSGGAADSKPNIPVKSSSTPKNLPSKPASTPAPRPAPSEPQQPRGFAQPRPPQPKATGASWGGGGVDMAQKRKEDEDQKKSDEKKAAEDRRRREKEFQKKEEEYIRSGGTKANIQQVKQRREMEQQVQQTVDPANCEAQFDVIDFTVHSKNGKPEFVTYKIEVQYSSSTWTIHRRWKQVTALDTAFRKELPGYVQLLPPKPQNYKQIKFDKGLLGERTEKLREYMNIVCNSRPAIFMSQNSKESFTRFIAPIQYGDQKGPDYFLPFKLVL